MGKVHQMLYKSKNFSEIDFAAFIESMVNEMKITYNSYRKKIDVALELEPVALHMDTAIPVSLILNEMLVNAFKHAFPRKSEGQIVVTFKKKDNAYELQVNDNGIGMSEELLSGKGKTLGLRLIYMLSQQLHGSVLYKRSNGSQFTIAFKNIMQ